MLFEVVELHFDKFAVFQRIIQGCKELRAQTLFAHLQGGLEPLSLGFENTQVRVGVARLTLPCGLWMINSWKRVVSSLIIPWVVAI